MTLTVKDVCERYGVTDHTVLGWIRGGELKAVNVGRDPRARKPRWRVTEAAIAAFEELRSASPPPAARSPRRLKNHDVIRWY